MGKINIIISRYLEDGGYLLAPQGWHCKEKKFECNVCVHRLRCLTESRDSKNFSLDIAKICKAAEKISEDNFNKHAHTLVVSKKSYDSIRHFFEDGHDR